MDIKIELNKILEQKLNNLSEKYIKALKSYNTKVSELIKQVDPSFEGNVDDFFHMHSIVNGVQTMGLKKYYVAPNQWIDYDYIDKSNNTGFIYDEIGKKVYKSLKHSKEYLEFNFYSNLVFTILNELNKDFYDQNVKENKDTIKADNVSNKLL